MADNTECDDRHFQLIDSENIPGATLKGKCPEQLTKAELLRWLRCRSGASLKGKKAELLERVKLYIQHGWDQKYLVNPDKHNPKVYSDSIINANEAFLHSLFDHPPPTGFTTSLQGIPYLEDSDIHQYFLVKCDDNSVTAKKHRDSGWNFFKSGKVIASEFHCDLDDTVLLVRGSVEASFDRGLVTGQCKKQYQVYIGLDKHSGSILVARCLCKAGLGGYCKHVASVLFNIIDSQREGLKFTREGGSKTSKLQTWHQPKVKGNSCIKFDNLQFESFSYERDNDSRTVKRQRTEYKACEETECISRDDISNFAANLKALGVAEHLTEILEANHYQPATKSVENDPVEVAVPDLCTNASKFKSHKENFQATFSVTDEEAAYYETNVKISSITEQMEISNETRGQSKTTAWMEERKKRLTASNFKSVCNRLKFPCDKFVENLTSGNNCSFSKHTVWGKQSESVALAQYKTAKTAKGYTVQLQDLGLIVNPKYPYLGASPDSLVTLSDGIRDISGLVEVKSLSKYSNLTPKQASEMPDIFYSFEGDCLKIKQDHSYYYQIQGQLAICEVEWCELVVWTPLGMAIQRIYRDQGFWARILPKLSAFYFEHMLPVVCQKN